MPQGITETTTLMFENLTNKTTASTYQPQGNRESSEFTTAHNDTFYQKFIIVIDASAVSVVLIAASLLVCVYRKYHHLSDAFELATAPTDDLVDTFQRTNIPILEDVPDNRQSRLEIYETIPMSKVSPFSHMADNYPLTTQGAHVLENMFGSGSESSVEILHYYETVPDSQNNEVASSYVLRKFSMRDFL